jgi:hypothetical protein
MLMVSSSTNPVGLDLRPYNLLLSEYLMLSIAS